GVEPQGRGSEEAVNGNPNQQEPAVAHAISQGSGWRGEQGNKERRKCGDQRHHHRNMWCIAEVRADTGEDGTNDSSSDGGKPGGGYQRPTLDCSGLMIWSFVDDNVFPAFLNRVLRCVSLRQK